MFRRGTFTLMFLVLASCLSVAVYAQLLNAQKSVLATKTKFLLGQATRAQLLQSLNKQVELEGYFCESSSPILVQDMKLVSADLPIPPDKYVPLTGELPPSLKTGAKVRLAGLLQKPTGEQLGGENLALKLASGSKATILQQAPSAILNQSALQAITGIQPLAPVANETRYALLIGGGQTSATNYPRYWNDLWQMYHILLAYGYSPANIRVAYAGGVPYPGGGGMPLNYPATWSGITAAFSYFVPKVKATDTFSIFVVGQGYNSPLVYWAWGSQGVSPTMFAGQVNRITSYKQITILLHSPYSGAFVPALTRPKRIIITGAAANKVTCAHPSYMYGNFSYWYLSALAKKHLLGSAAFNTDANSNGQISKTEAYNCTLSRPGYAPYDILPIAAQMPQFEDNGIAPSHFTMMPSAGSGGDGNVGKDSYF